MSQYVGFPWEKSGGRHSLCCRNPENPLLSLGGDGVCSSAGGRTSHRTSGWLIGSGRAVTTTKLMVTSTKEMVTIGTEPQWLSLMDQKRGKQCLAKFWCSLWPQWKTWRGPNWTRETEEALIGPGRIERP